MTATAPQIVQLGENAFDDVVAVLCAAFHDYPVMRYILKESAGDYDAQLTELIGYFTDSRVSRSWPVLGALLDGKLVAAANINPPRSAPQPPSLKKRYERLHDRLGPAAMARFEAFADAAKPFTPDEPHYYLGMLGVRPECRGRRLARYLLDALHDMSARDPDSTGVFLTTEDPRNLTLYERFGYRVVGRGQAEELVTWGMFRPDPPPGRA
ncbi:MAG: GNAT family N-acetyltransferase [Acidobacteriota bacterium]|nr:MAG: GNAT family N-acetyltransferase [Acidobacteriota bacterium]